MIFLKNYVLGLTMKIVSIYNMELYSLNRNCFVSRLHTMPSNIKFVRITKEVLEANKSYYPKRYNLWKHNLKKGAEGLFAMCDNRIVGHGWLKKKGSKDPFYRIGDNVAYLSEFFVHPDFRGNGIYPAMLSHFISQHKDCYSFYISVYTHNVSSRKGLLKVGFQCVSYFKFIRTLKITLNKHRIVEETNGKHIKKILVVGSGAYQIPLIKRIVEMGNQAYCVDKNPDAPGFNFATEYKVIDVLDKKACLDYAKEIGIDAVMTYGATLTLPTVAYIGKSLGLPALPIETAELSKSKYDIKKRLMEKGCNIKGSFFRMNSLEEARNYKFELPCVLKPSDGSGSKGVSVVHNNDDISPSIRYAFENARYGEIYCESFIPGDEYSVEAFVCGDDVYVYCIVKTTFEKGENGEVSYGHRTPSGLSADKEELITNEVKKAIRALNITMASVNFDVILSLDDGKPYIIDCGIRVGQNLISSHLVPLSRGVSVLDNTINLALGRFVDAKPKYNKCIATRLLIYRPGTIVEIKPMDDIIGTEGIVDVVMKKGVGDVQNEYREKSDTCGWVITAGDTPDEAEGFAIKAKKLLEKYIIIK